jgi:hypothetical protein
MFAAAGRFDVLASDSVDAVAEEPVGEAA